jgi:hypothetical protein
MVMTTARGLQSGKIRVSALAAASALKARRSQSANSKRH